MPIDVNKELKGVFYTMDELRGRQVKERIADTDSSEYGPFAAFASGRKCGLTRTSMTLLKKKWGDAANWNGQSVIVEIGPIQGRDGLCKIVRPDIEAETGVDPEAQDDDIPF